jgi:hypothetical protein
MRPTCRSHTSPSPDSPICHRRLVALHFRAAGNQADVQIIHLQQWRGSPAAAVGESHVDVCCANGCTTVLGTKNREG